MFCKTIHFLFSLLGNVSNLPSLKYVCTVKILVAAEYAMQVDEGILIKDSIVSLDELNKFYLKGSDGNAHKDWLEEMENNQKNDWPFHQSVFHLLRITNAY